MEHLKRGYGLDDQGFIKSDVSLDKVDSIYKPCIEDTVERLKQSFETELHSVYLYGSVARGDATPVKSDLDLIAIFNQPLNQNRLTELKQLQLELTKKYRHLLREVGIASDHIEAVMMPSKYYDNAFIQALSVCLYGEDLGESFGPYPLTADIPLSFNGDISNFYKKMLPQLKTANVEDLPTLTEKISRKLIRTFYSMVMIRAQIWTTKLHEQADVFLHYFPMKTAVVETLLNWLDEPPLEKEPVYDLFEKEGKWASTNFEKEAVKTIE